MFSFIFKPPNTRIYKDFDSESFKLVKPDFDCAQSDGHPERSRRVFDW